jgi:hypothetical protein|tara:strand:- start:1022 stop:1126 length:105 start_codon:yes stop_codon:yes gene_type:complete
MSDLDSLGDKFAIIAMVVIIIFWGVLFLGMYLGG